jgi:F-type H+-transporting ATPase subunit a
MKKFSSFFALFFIFLAQIAFAGGDEGAKFAPKDMIIHHISDAHDWHLFDLEKEGKPHAVSIPLPVILYTDGNFDVFMSSAFDHGKAEVIRGDRTYKNEHEHIIEAGGKKVIDLSITKNVASMMISVALLLGVFFSVAGSYKARQGQAPKGIQSFFEPLIVFIRDDVAIPNIGEKKYATYLPYLLTVFFFIWFNNLLGLLPTGANASGNIAFTMTLAVLTGLITNLSGNSHYWLHILWTPGVPHWLRIIMLPVELIGILTKPFALMIRLFANITAGHIVILSLLSFIFIFKSYAVGLVAGTGVIIMTFLELFVAILQAYIFTLLSALFIGLAVEEPHHEHGHEQESGHH